MVVQRTSMLTLIRAMKIIFNKKTEFQEIIRFLETLFLYMFTLYTAFAVRRLSA